MLKKALDSFLVPLHFLGGGSEVYEVAVTVCSEGLGGCGGEVGGERGAGWKEFRPQVACCDEAEAAPSYISSSLRCGDDVRDDAGGGGGDGRDA